MSKTGKVLLTIASVAVLTTAAGFVFGPEAAGTAFLLICVFVGGYVGTGWGGRQATKTDAYRQEWLNKKSQRPDADGGTKG